MKVASIRIFQNRVVELRDYFKSRISKSNKIDSKKVFSADTAAYILINSYYEGMRTENIIPKSAWIEAVMEMRDKPELYEDWDYYREASYWLWVEVFNKKRDAAEGYQEMVLTLLSTLAFGNPREFMEVDEEDFNFYDPYSVAELVVRLDGIEVEEEFARRFFRWIKQ